MFNLDSYVESDCSSGKTENNIVTRMHCQSLYLVLNLIFFFLPFIAYKPLYLHCNDICRERKLKNELKHRA